jgi:hypothetical protein
VFYVPFDWLQLAVAAQDVTTIGGRHSYRLSPSAEVRLTRNLSVAFDTRDVWTGVADGRSRTYSLQLSVKAIE